MVLILGKTVLAMQCVMIVVGGHGVDTGCISPPSRLSCNHLLYFLTCLFDSLSEHIPGLKMS